MMRAVRAIALSIGALAGVQARAADVTAEAPVGLAVTVYRAPGRAQGSMDLDHLEGFALVSETRMVHLPAGTSRLRFEGVADGIEAQSAIVTGLPVGVLEKNRDAKVLSPASLVAETVGKAVELLRTDRKSGKTQRIAGTILSDAEGGVVFKTAAGIEALRCSGLPERFEFEPAGAPAARPTLSVLVRSTAAQTARVTLSYLSRGFDWSADYSATLSPDGHSMQLGAWVTLANSNGTGFPAAHVQLVAGRVNREQDSPDPIELGGPILAECWPRGSTSDSPPQLLAVAQDAVDRGFAPRMMAAPSALASVTVTAMRKVEQEQLGDLKLYRVPELTTLASRQSKQVRLLDKSAIPVTTLYRTDLLVGQDEAAQPAERLLRTVNDEAHHLGLPLPAGGALVSALRGDQPLLLQQTALRDLAVNEKVEIGLGSSADVQVALTNERTGAGSELPPLVPGGRARLLAREELQHVQITNARADDIRVELRTTLPDGALIIRADQPPQMRDGRAVFAVTVPAQGVAALRFQVGYPRAHTR